MYLTVKQPKHVYERSDQSDGGNEATTTRQAGIRVIRVSVDDDEARSNGATA